MAKLSLILILAVLAASVQCAAACTPAAMPHCHHHKQAPKQACSNELVAANPAQAWGAAPGVAYEPLSIEPGLGALAPAAMPQALDSPPPGGRSLSVLRI